MSARGESPQAIVMTEVFMPRHARLDAAGVLHHVINNRKKGLPAFRDAPEGSLCPGKTKETCRGQKRLLFLRGDGTGNRTEGSRHTFRNLRTGYRSCRREGKANCTEEGIEAYLTSFLFF